jgi:hypothetical protein
MRKVIVGHIRGNAVGYVALFAALGGTSYAAVSLPAGSVTSRALANRAVTHAKLGSGSIADNNLRKHTLTAADFATGALAQALNGTKVGPAGASGRAGTTGSGGSAGPRGPAGHDGSAAISARVRGTGSVTAPHQASTNVPLTGVSWTQAANDLNLITGSMSVGIPASCTGSFGNELVVSVDGTPTTIGLAPTAPAKSTVTVPFVVGEVMEPGSDTQHTIKASMANTCSKSGEDYTISNVKADVVTFH